MNPSINDGGPAFPVPMFTRQADGQPMSAGEFFEGGNGLSLRDWMAGMAMQGATGFVNEHEDHYEESLTHTAVASYRIADAMLLARLKQVDTPVQTDKTKELIDAVEAYFVTYTNFPKKPKWCERVDAAKLRINKAIEALRA